MGEFCKKTIKYLNVTRESQSTTSSKFADIKFVLNAD